MADRQPVWRRAAPRPTEAALLALGAEARVMLYKVTCNHEVDPVAKKNELMDLVRAAGCDIYHTTPLRRHFSFRVPKGHPNPLANRLDEFTSLQESELEICNETAEEAEQRPEARPNQDAA